VRTHKSAASGEPFEAMANAFNLELLKDGLATHK
jgi:hypothetical protein